MLHYLAGLKRLIPFYDDTAHGDATSLFDAEHHVHSAVILGQNPGFDAGLVIPFLLIQGVDG